MKNSSTLKYLALVGLLILGFQNCTKVTFRESLSENKMKPDFDAGAFVEDVPGEDVPVEDVPAAEDPIVIVDPFVPSLPDTVAVPTTPTPVPAPAPAPTPTPAPVPTAGTTPSGEVLVPVQDEPKSVYVCPEGTSAPGTVPAASKPKATSAVKPASNSNISMASGVSYGRGYASSSSYASSGPNGNTARVVQQGDTNYASIYQSGTNNQSSVVQRGNNNSSTGTQNGTNNTACVVQIGEKNDSLIEQNGQTNAAGVRQVGGQSSRIVQNGTEVTGATHNSAESCGCRLVHCDSSNSSLIPECRQASVQKVITK